MTFLISCGICDVLTIILLVVVGILGVHYIYFMWDADYWKKKGVFSPNPRALLGNLPGQMTNKRHIIYDMDDLYQKYKSQHSYIGIFQFREPRLLVFDPEVIKEIMIKNFRFFQGTEFFSKIDKSSDPLFGEHSFFLIGDEWKTKRNEISPAFTNNRIKAIFPISQNVNEQMISYVNKQLAKPDHDGFDAKDLAARFTLSVVSNSIYNIDASCFTEDEPELLKVSMSFLAPSNYRLFQMMVLTIYPFMSKFFKMGFTGIKSAEYFRDLMDQAMNFRTENKIDRIDYLDHLLNLRNKKEISDHSIAAHGASFLVDGFDTSSSGISSALYELGKNKDVQDKLREILFNDMPTEDDFTYDNIMNCQYLDNIWNETLRLHSPATYLSRFCNEPVTLDMPKDKKVSFDYGDIVLFPTDAINMDPEYHPDPEKFDPDRFLPENGGVKKFIDAGTLFTFGIGPRACPGARFAVAQSKIAIARLVRSFEISINPKTPEKFVIPPQAVIVTLNGATIDLKPVKRDE